MDAAAWTLAYLAVGAVVALVVDVMQCKSGRTRLDSAGAVIVAVLSWPMFLAAGIVGAAAGVLQAVREGRHEG